MSKDLRRICHFIRDDYSNQFFTKPHPRTKFTAVHRDRAISRKPRLSPYTATSKVNTQAMFHTCSVCIGLTQMSLNNRLDRHSRKFAWPIDRYTAIRISRPIKSILLHSINPFLKLIERYWGGRRLIIRLSTRAAADKTAANPRR